MLVILHLPRFFFPGELLFVCLFVLEYITVSFALWLPGLSLPNKGAAQAEDQKVGREREKSPCGL